MQCFKAYDIRGRVPDELNKDLAFRIGRAYAACIAPQQVVIGYDIRLSSPGLADALAEGLMESGVDVIALGLCGTEEVYFATFHLQVDGGIMITASHNPADYNGMKFVRQEARPISGDSGLRDIEKLTAVGDFPTSNKRGIFKKLDVRPAYLEHLLNYIDVSLLKPLKIVVNVGNGCGGAIIDLLEKRLPFTFIKLLFTPDGTFPNGVPNPLLPENREMTTSAVREHSADLEIAWDGDFDRCFLFDERGEFVEGYYIVGLLAKAMLSKNPGAKIIHDPRSIWNSQDVIAKAGGMPVMSKTGHAFIKERMRREDAVYGGEMSGHHYFRDFAYCDSGMIPWLLVVEILSRGNRKLSELTARWLDAWPVSGEINSQVSDPDGVIQKIDDFYSKIPGTRDYVDGLSFTAHNFRFNIRKSNTESLLRLNVETRGNKLLLQEKTRELLLMINEKKI